ncbi:hypothetical protein TNCV_3726241 [Trichonephila clavipes]|nr:hypothetical protein TNCV_3726241 [Trichonephila clavipes]
MLLKQACSTSHDLCKCEQKMTRIWFWSHEEFGVRDIRFLQLKGSDSFNPSNICNWLEDTSQAMNLRDHKEFHQEFPLLSRVSYDFWF